MRARPNIEVICSPDGDANAAVTAVLDLLAEAIADQLVTEAWAAAAAESSTTRAAIERAYCRARCLPATPATASSSALHPAVGAWLRLTEPKGAPR